MKKGFIFSITALYFVVIFLLFLGLFVLVTQKSIYKQDISLMDKTNWRYLSGNASDIQPTTENYVCVEHLVYDADQDSSNQSAIIRKKYCENYGIQRFI